MNGPGLHAKAATKMPSELEKKVKYLALALAVTLAACVQGTSNPTIDAPVPAVDTSTEAALRQQLSDATLLAYSPVHGTQVEYTAPDGKAYLWYPGNPGPVVGEWTADTDGTGSAIVCFKYPANTYNPETEEWGGRWWCKQGAGYVADEDHLVSGDPFNLASGRIPYVMPSGPELTFEQLGRPLGLDIASPN